MELKGDVFDFFVKLNREIDGINYGSNRYISADFNFFSIKR